MIKKKTKKHKQTSSDCMRNKKAVISIS